MEIDGESKFMTRQWWRSRFPIAEASFQSLAAKSVPTHKFSWMYFLGGMTLSVLIIQFITGILLLLYYQPATISANASVQFIMRTVPGGLFIKSLHAWCANAVVVLVFVHGLTAALMRSYRQPRELTWLSGALCFMIIMGLAFSGYLLPWNTLSVYATKVGVQVMQTSTSWLPGFLAGLGPAVGGFFTQSGAVGQDTLTRFFALHVVILPICLVILLCFHLLLVQMHGMSVPMSISEHGSAEKFFPQVLLKDLAIWVVLIACICVLADVLPYDYFLPYRLATPYDPLASAPSGIRPEWYFLFLYYPLELMPRALVITATLVLTISFLALPWVMNGIPALWGSSIERSKFPVWSVALAAAVIVLMTIFGADLVQVLRGAGP